MEENKKKLTYVTGKIVEMTKPEVVEMQDGKLSTKAIVTFEIEPGQVIYFQARYSVISHINSNPNLLNNKVSVGFIFIGTHKNDRYYNNLFITRINETH